MNKIEFNSLPEILRAAIQATGVPLKDIHVKGNRIYIPRKPASECPECILSGLCPDADGKPTGKTPDDIIAEMRKMMDEVDGKSAGKGTSIDFAEVRRGFNDFVDFMNTFADADADDFMDLMGAVADACKDDDGDKDAPEYGSMAELTAADAKLADKTAKLIELGVTRADTLAEVTGLASATCAALLREKGFDADGDELEPETFIVPVTGAIKVRAYSASDAIACVKANVGSIAVTEKDVIDDEDEVYAATMMSANGMLSDDLIVGDLDATKGGDED